jgi:hypothetical protein
MRQGAGMPPVTVAAVPLDLLDLATRTAEPDHRARAAVVALDARLAAAGRSGTALGAAVTAHVGRARALAGRTAATGLAFLAAGGPAGTLALVLHLAHPAGVADPEAAAAALAEALGLPAGGDGQMRRTGVDPLHVSWLAAAIGPSTLAQVARAHPHLIGPVDGMPVDLRYEANRLLALRGAVAADAIGAHDRAAALRDLAAPHRRLLFVDAARGQAAEVLGELTGARHVAVVVPGMGNSLEGFAVVRAKAEALRSAAAALDPPASLAAIAWLGYASPGVPDMVLDDAARAGAPALVQLAGGVAVVAPTATMTVVGHSYGTLVTAHALRDGLDVDAVALTGSPGVRADDAEDLGETPVYALRAPGDYVALLERFGTDPTDPDFGATRLATGEFVGHRGYFDEGTESLRNLALVATGRAAEATVVRPGWGERAFDVAEDARTLVVETPVDLAQDAVGGGAGILSWLADEAEERLPDPVARVVDGTQDTAGVVLEVGDGLVDLGQRLTSPDLYGDLAGDAWDVVFG